MSDERLALLLTILWFALMAAWVPFLDLVQRVVRGRNPRMGPAKSRQKFQTNL